MICKEAVELVKKFEGLYLSAYTCAAGVWTIGYGHTGGVKRGDKITREQAESYLISDLSYFEKKVRSLGLALTENQVGALTSFAFNCGEGNLKTLVKNRSKSEIASAMLLYNKAAGKTLEGLKKRRIAEAELFLKGDTVKTDLPTIRKGSCSYAVEVARILLGCGHGFEFDSELDSFVRDFQKASNLAVDGIIGVRTWGELLK